MQKNRHSMKENRESLNRDLRQEVIKKLYNSIVWTHKIHEKQAEIYYSNYKKLFWLELGLSIITSFGVLSLIQELFPEYQRIILIVSGIASVLVTAVTIVGEGKNFNKQAIIHKEFAVKFLKVRDSLFHLLFDFEANDKHIDYIRFEFEKINSLAHALYEVAPQTTPKALELAKIALISENESSYSEEEANRFLPGALQ